MRRAYRLGAIGLVAAVAAVIALVPHGRPVPRHLVLVSLDTLRADHLGAYGYPRPTSPVFDRLAAGGVLFERAVAQGPSTLPSHGALLTGLYPSAYGDGFTPFGPPAGMPTLAGVLGAAGFSTWAFVDGGYLARGFGLAQGFEHYEDTRVGLARLVERVDGWLGAHTAARTFLFVHCYDIHTPYAPPPAAREALGAEPWRGKTRVTAADLEALEQAPRAPDPPDLGAVVGLYDAGIRATDETLGRLIDVLRRRGIWDDAVVVVLSDHGEEFFEHGQTQHKQLYFHPNLHVPLLVLAPSLASRRVATTVQLVDVLPTVLELLGLPPHEAAMGRSLVSVMADGAGDGDGRAYAEGTVWTAALRTLVTDRYQLLYDVHTRKARLYAADDPTSRHDVAGRQPALTAALVAELESRVRAAAARRPASGPPTTLDDATRRELRALGYVE